MKKAILIDHEPWTLRRKQLFYDLFKKAGIPFQVWDLSQWLHPGFTNPNEIYDVPYLTKVYNRKQFQELLKKENPAETIIVEEVFRVWGNRHVFIDVVKYNFKSIKIDLYGNTTLIRNNFIRDIKNGQIYHKLLTLLRGGVIDRIFTKIYFSIHGIQSIPYLFSSNNLYGSNYKINHPDYEDFKFKEHKKLISGKYIVFCDIYFPLHSDLKVFYKYKDLPNAGRYQESMRNLFDFIETKHKSPVVIAAHPKSNYKGNEFGNRQIIKYNTDNLVYYADKVILHLSCSISYSILGNKEMALVSTKDYESIPHFRSAINIWERVLGMRFQNIDNNLIDFKFYRMDSKLREKYICSYLTSSDTENLPNSDILHNFFEQCE